MSWTCNYASVSCCSAVAAQQCSDEGTVRFVNGTTQNEGKVVICYNRRWSTICITGWGLSEAAVACRELGFKCTCIRALFTTPATTNNHSLLQMVFLSMTIKQHLFKVIIITFRVLEMSLIFRAAILGFATSLTVLE